MTFLFLIPLVTIVVVGAMSMASIFDFRKRPLNGYMRSPFESDRIATSADRATVPAGLLHAWTRELRGDNHELPHLELAPGDACASCAITCDEEEIPSFSGDDLEQIKGQLAERSVHRA